MKTDRDLFIYLFASGSFLYLKANVVLLSNGEWASLIWAFKYCDLPYIGS
jgi:hypothetical protein